jgi:hypothetical protein
MTFSVTGGASNGMRLSVYTQHLRPCGNIRFAGGGNEEVRSVCTTITANCTCGSGAS